MTPDSPVAIITGAGRGIGRTAAVEVARRGYRVALAARTVAQLEETRRLVAGSIAIPTDITQPAQIDQLVRTTLNSFGRIDAIVNNAGLAPSLSVEQTTVEQWHQILNTNLSAAFYLTRAVWPIFKEQNSGVIVNISSVASRDPFSGLTAYATAKAGLNMLSLALAREGKPHNIRVHTVAPGAVETQMFRALVSEENWPRDKTLQPADVARVIAQCICGDLRYTSGEVIFLQM